MCSQPTCKLFWRMFLKMNWVIWWYFERITWCLDSSGILLAWRILPPIFIKPLWKIGCKLAIFEMLCTENPVGSVLNSRGNYSCCIICKSSVLLEASSIAVRKLMFSPVGAPLFFHYLVGFYLEGPCYMTCNVKNDECRDQLIFDASLLFILDVLLVAFVSLFSKCSMIISPGSTV